MDIYRLWYLRQRGKVQGPFPEALVCRFMVLGRVGERDEVSLDGEYWRAAEDVPELAEGVRALLRVHEISELDSEWSEERARAVLRWLDDRKSPDPRKRETIEAQLAERDKRSGVERRKTPETVEQHAYRIWRAEFENWMRQQRHRYFYAWVGIAAFVVIGVLFVLFYQPVNPVRVDLRLSRNDCAQPAKAGVRWSGCRKDDTLLIGVDLRGAELIGTSFRGTSLRQADLRQANLAQADLAHADLRGARLSGAIWVDGRVCAEGSVGSCREE